MKFVPVTKNRCSDFESLFEDFIYKKWKSPGTYANSDSAAGMQRQYW
jgi:hypothetical protein